MSRYSFKMVKAGLILLAVALASCGQSTSTAANPEASPLGSQSAVASPQPSPISTPSASPATPASPSADASPTESATSDLLSVAAKIYPLAQGVYVTCDFGYAGASRYSHCPITARLNDRLVKVFSGYISAPEPLGGGQDPEWPSESITADVSGTGGVAHVVLTKPESPSSRYDLVIIQSGSQLLVDDIYCTGADRATSSIYADGWMNRYSC